ncbi:MAG TPA: class I SAM-dependent methyltransferase [Candidatus Paceibacterota bacterium]
MKGTRFIPKRVSKKIFNLLTPFRVLGWSLIKWTFLSKDKKYAYFQRKRYDWLANISDEAVVGNYEEHNKWKDYDEFLMKYAYLYKDKLALDFGTGVGRNIIRYHDRFRRLDGVDIGSVNIGRARKKLKRHKIDSKLYVNNGFDLSEIRDNVYGFIFSTITLQHICCYSTRFNLLKEFYRALEKGGRISIQMGFGKTLPNYSVGYYEDYFNALKTNGAMDTQISSPEQVGDDLKKIGFEDFEYWIRNAGPGGGEGIGHEKWIFFTAKKP